MFKIANWTQFMIEVWIGGGRRAKEDGQRREEKKVSKERRSWIEGGRELQCRR